jgi:hypothetical protein
MRTLGFALPTVAMVTAGHLSAEASVGEAVDGVVSGLWFTAHSGLMIVAGWIGTLRTGALRRPVA